MEVNITKKQIAFFFAMIVSLTALSVFLYQTGILLKPLILIIISMFVIGPFAKDSPFAKRMLILISLLFIGWLLSDLGFALVPFIISFLIAYLLDPFISGLAKRGISRMLLSFLVVALIVGSVVVVAVIVSPMLFDQLDDAIERISDLVLNTKSYFNSKAFYDFMRDFGLSEENAKYIVQVEIMPKIEYFMSGILESLRKLLTNISALANQLVNIILIPVLLFYFIKDFRVIIDRTKGILEHKNQKLLYDLRRIGRILRKYISWQLTAAFIVGSVCSFFFSVFDVPYPIVLGMFCGILNPIPYLGIFASMIVSGLTVLIVGSPFVITQLLVVVIVIGAMHFINAYLLEPNIAGKMIGLHPVLLIASLFVFGGMWGFLGLLIAVPLTATLVMFFEDWVAKSKTSDFLYKK